MADSTNSASVRDEPDRHFAEALSIVNREDLDYLVRLDMLQTWLVRVADGTAVHGSKKEIEGAILALQSRSKLKMDTPPEQPETTTYGGVERSDLREYGFQRLLNRLRGAFRK